MDIIPVKTPGFIPYIFPNYTWSIPSKDKVLYLTFDDGPTPGITEWVLDTLKSFQARATFFCIGNNIVNHPTLFRRILTENHAVGNHTFNHLKGWKTGTRDYISNIYKAEEQINRIKSINSMPGQRAEDDLNSSSLSKIDALASNRVKLFRPPYGRIRPIQAQKLRKMGYKIVMWSVLAKDWDKRLTHVQCLNNVINNAASGDIIVLHDSVKASTNLKFVLPEVLAHFSQKGYLFKRIPG
jgi:peptidoglycan/xylan/chitin deacetylase (PgdA/CDA1 family)